MSGKSENQYLLSLDDRKPNYVQAYNPTNLPKPPTSISTLLPESAKIQSTAKGLLNSNVINCVLLFLIGASLQQQQEAFGYLYGYRGVGMNLGNPHYEMATSIDGL